MKHVRFGIIGVGGMGTHHARYLAAKTLPDASLAALCDTRLQNLEKAAAKFPGIPTFASHKDLLASGTCDAVIIASPHYDHVPAALDAFAANHHVLCEKPLAASITAARQLAEAYKNYPHLRFGIVFNQRSNPLYRKMRELILGGELGAICRVTWLVTDWFRTNAYYASSSWRATWKGEGGGVLINQCAHQLDLIQWVTGMMPKRVTAVGFIGKTHPIEVEDEISAILEYPAVPGAAGTAANGEGAIGHFVASTGEYPGTNRFEVSGSRGKLIAEDHKLTFIRTRVDVQEFNRTATEGFTRLETWHIDVPLGVRNSPEHQFMAEDFVHVIVNDLPAENLLAPGCEGVNGLELGNAIVMSGLTRKAVDLPLDGAAYDAFIEEMSQKYAGLKYP